MTVTCPACSGDAIITVEHHSDNVIPDPSGDGLLNTGWRNKYTYFSCQCGSGGTIKTTWFDLKIKAQKGKGNG